MKRTLGTNPTATIDYSYNDIYELTNVTNAQTHSYDYDKVANRQIADGVTYTPNNLNQYTQVGSTTYLYDGQGNLTNDGNNSYTYDEENRMASASDSFGTANYEYDALNRRIKKDVSGVVTYYIWDGDRDLTPKNCTRLSWSFSCFLSKNSLGERDEQWLFVPLN